MSYKSYIFLFLIILIFASCGNENSIKSNRVIVGIPSDIETFSPLFAFSLDEGSITELLFLSLVRLHWDNKDKDLKIKQMFAKSWEWNSDSTSVTLDLRDDVKWSDGIDCTAEDVVFSLDAYSDPAVESRLYGTFDDYYSEKNLHINLKKTFEVISPYKLKINFRTKSLHNFYNLVFPIIPKHIYEKLDRKNYSTAEVNFKPVTNGPFAFKSWDKNKTIILETNKNSFLYNPNNISQLIFKVVPDYNSRLTQLKKDEIDLMELVKPDDIKELEKKNIAIVPVKGREYDYIGWNNIDYEFYKKNKIIIPNKLFGNSQVRIALTEGINRQEILKEFLGKYGQLAVSPISPIFKNAIDTTLKPYPYNPKDAAKLLKEAGWADTNNDGILDKNRKKFSFTLFIPSGNPRSDFASTIVKNNLREIGVDVKVQEMELGVFRDNLYNKNFDAYMASWFVPIPIELKPVWYSDIEKTPQNLVSYQSRLADKLLDAIEKNTSREKLNDLYFKFQKIIHKDMPVTFLYWMDNLVGYNKKINNIDINPLGVVQECWNWSVKN